MKKKAFLLIILICFIPLALYGLKHYSDNQKPYEINDLKPWESDKKIISKSEDGITVPNKAADPKEPPVEETAYEVSIVSVGDIMFHMPQVSSSREGNSFNFKPMFSEVKNFIASKDIAVGNLETTINPKKALSGYPSFNSPVEVLDALKDTGFDYLLTNNNHILDTGIEGVKSTNKLVKSYGLKTVGSGEKDEAKYQIEEKNNIKIGMLAYTYGTNYGNNYKENINYIDKDKIKSDIAKMNPQCDFIITYLHIGTEYVRSVEPFQAEIVNAAAEAGADAVLCSHPHVSRKSELLKVNGREVYVNYSMGNFISNQNDKYTDIGSMTSLVIEKRGSQTKLKSAETIPVYRLRYKTGNKNIYKTVLHDSVNKFKNILSEPTLAYINQTSKQLLFKYNNSEAKPVNN
jgi:poly-gamma-glutamate synthesis protein (capsule biosynthesis protein)